MILEARSVSSRSSFPMRLVAVQSPKSETNSNGCDAQHSHVDPSYTVLEASFVVPATEGRVVDQAAADGRELPQNTIEIGSFVLGLGALLVLEIARRYFLIDVTTITSTLATMVVPLLVTLAYLFFYTAYDKSTKALNFSILVTLFTCDRGVEWTLVELNKLISLAGLTILLLSFLPILQISFLRGVVDATHHHDMLVCAMVMLWIHSLYSIYKFYGYNWRRFSEEIKIKQFSIVLGTCGQLAISLGCWGTITAGMLIVSATLFGLGHFFTMEIDYKYELQVRPFAMLPFPLACIVLLYFSRTLLF